MLRTRKKACPAASIEREDAVKAAVRAVEGQSAAKLFGIPYNTLHDHYSGELVKLHLQVHCSSIPLP